MNKNKNTLLVFGIFTLLFTFITFLDISKTKETLAILDSSKKIGFFIGFFLIQGIMIGLGISMSLKRKKLEKQERSIPLILFYLSFCITVFQVVFLFI
ncbi:MAG: hypothetical protein PHN72_01600 [Bacilli bacterium]|nr:hypothetical protein [Bacilli bacterium]